MAAINGAIQEHKEWRRIGHVMAEENLETYTPDADPTVLRWRREDEERQATEKAAQTQAAAAEADERLAADHAPAQVVLTGLARAGLHDLDGEDHQALQHLAHLDDATLHRTADWLERTRTTALRALPPRPAHRRPPPESWTRRS
ncbi:hypothetical protein ACFV4M_03805 [Kitasatospora indigofera]|uniref:hypothetical protein n=1 Tax=Kitasatospora indigofera TaxID=67307 RepID=UPI00364D75E5